MSGVPPLELAGLDVADDHEMITRFDDLVHAAFGVRDAVVVEDRGPSRPFGRGPPYTGELVDASRGERVASSPRPAARKLTTKCFASRKAVSTRHVCRCKTKGAAGRRRPSTPRCS